MLLHLVGVLLTLNYDAWNNEYKKKKINAISQKYQNKEIMPTEVLLK